MAWKIQKCKDFHHRNMYKSRPECSTNMVDINYYCIYIVQCICRTDQIISQANKDSLLSSEATAEWPPNTWAWLLIRSELCLNFSRSETGENTNNSYIVIINANNAMDWIYLLHIHIYWYIIYIFSRFPRGREGGCDWKTIEAHPLVLDPATAPYCR